MNRLHRLVCRDCGFVWEPEKTELIGAAKLEEMVLELAAKCTKLVFPEADEEQLQHYTKGRLEQLREVCFWYDDHSPAERYVVHFNMFTRLVQTFGIISYLVKTTANVANTRKTVSD